jgi:hypothetical protein
MAAQRSRWLFLSLSLVLIIYIRDLLGQTSGKVVEGKNIGAASSQVCGLKRTSRCMGMHGRRAVTFVGEKRVPFLVPLSSNA